ncbi:MAG: hypothetical protein HUU55_11325 [Myxococcales bacterium]|nr:hypothetical protein [Myxococcales bacterium]
MLWLLFAVSPVKILAPYSRYDSGFFRTLRLKFSLPKIRLKNTSHLARNFYEFEVTSVDPPASSGIWVDLFILAMMLSGFRAKIAHHCQIYWRVGVLARKPVIIPD